MTQGGHEPARRQWALAVALLLVLVQLALPAHAAVHDADEAGDICLVCHGAGAVSLPGAGMAAPVVFSGQAHVAGLPPAAIPARAAAQHQARAPPTVLR